MIRHSEKAEDILRAVERARFVANYNDGGGRIPTNTLLLSVASKVKSPASSNLLRSSVMVLYLSPRNT